MAKENKEWICSVCGYKPVCHVAREYFDEAGEEPEL